MTGTRATIILVCAALLLAGWAGSADDEATGPRPPVQPTSVPPVAAPTTVAPARAPLVQWTGPVEHLFFHTLVIRPDQAFTADSLAQGFCDYFVTVGEFRAIGVV